jgi:hypothetical protein
MAMAAITFHMHMLMPDWQIGPVKQLASVRYPYKASCEMLFGIYWLFFSFISFFLFFVNRTDDGASFCIAPSLLLRFFALWIVNHDLLL